MSDTTENSHTLDNQDKENMELRLENIPSVALRRIVEEVRNEGENEFLESTAYNRTYHRHNR